MRTVQFMSRVFSIITLVLATATVTDAADWIDLTKAVIVVPDDGKIVQTAQRILTEEIAKRTEINLTSSATPDDGTNPVIVLCRIDSVPAHLRGFVSTMKVPEPADGFAIATRTSGRVPIVVLAGRDERGVLFAAGRLLLQLRMKNKLLELPADYRVATAPRYPHRGHQIGYRQLAHCYDAWTPADFEQYMR